MKFISVLAILLMFIAHSNAEIKTKEENEFDKFLNERQITSSNTEIYAEKRRLYKKKDVDFPWKAKCSKYDYRIFNGCPQFRIFEPSARIYFDTGNDDPNEIDIFDDGSLTATIDIGGVFFPWRIGKNEHYDEWHWGPMFAIGIGAPAGNPEEGDEKASSAPVVYVSYGLLLDYSIGGKGNSLGFEIGGATGFSSDESVSDNDDSAIYVGFKLKISPF